MFGIQFKTATKVQFCLIFECQDFVVQHLFLLLLCWNTLLQTLLKMFPPLPSTLLEAVF